MGYTIKKLDDPKGQCGLHPSHKWAVMHDVWGFKDAFRTFGEAEAYVAELRKEAAEAASRFKGTPGPWFHSHMSMWGCVTTKPDGFGGIIAEVDSPATGRGRLDPIRVEETKANARLIAAAPDLLEVVQSALSVGYNENGWQERARAALKKAGIEE